MNPSDSDFHWLSSSTSILTAWVCALGFALLLALASSFLPAPLEKARRTLFLIFIFPALLVGLLYGVNGFHVWDRPVVHWIFDKSVADSLHLGVMFDPVSLIVCLAFGLTLSAVCFRNRPSVRVSATLVMGWVGLSLVATSKTIWMAALGLGIQMISRILPVFSEESSRSAVEDGLWTGSAKRSWIAYLLSVTGALGLASQGYHLDFPDAIAWSEFFASPIATVSGALLLSGFLVFVTPAFTAHVLHQESKGPVEAETFVYEAAASWSVALILHRLLPSLRGTPWAMAIGIGATVLLLLSLITLLFQETRRRSIYLWLACVPLLMLTILPFIQEKSAFLLVTGTALAFNGCLLCFDHLRTHLDRAFAGFFFCGVFGLVGWSSSAGGADFFSKIEALPVLVGGVLLVWVLFASAGWRIVLRGGDREEEGPSAVKWVVVGLLILIGFGPLLSGRWGGGGIPEAIDWVNGANEWHWVKAYAVEESSESWAGFGIVQATLLLSILLGTFVSASSALFPFAESSPRAKRATAELFGLFWILRKSRHALTKVGEWEETGSAWLWEIGIPRTIGAIYSGLRVAGSRMEESADVLTSEKFGKLFSAPSKLVQWLHGGNVRLYAWFALIWILIFSIYLTR